MFQSKYSSLSFWWLLSFCRFANLPEEVKQKTVHKESFYSFGWSHGMELLEGKPDFSKVHRFQFLLKCLSYFNFSFFVFSFFSLIGSRFSFCLFVCLFTDDRALITIIHNTMCHLKMKNWSKNTPASVIPIFGSSYWVFLLLLLLSMCSESVQKNSFSSYLFWLFMKAKRRPSWTRASVQGNGTVHRKCWFVVRSLLLFYF